MQRGVVGPERRRVERAQVVDGERLDRRRGAHRRRAVAVRRCRTATRENASGAIVAGSSRAWSRLVSRCWRSRSSSSFGNVGRSATSAMIGSASASRATGTCSRTADASMPLRGVEIGAEEVDGVGDLERRSRCRRPRRASPRSGWRRRTCPAGRRRVPLQHDEVDLHDRHFVQLDDPDRQAVRQLRASGSAAASAPAAARAAGGLRAIGRLLREQRRRRRAAATTATRRVDELRQSRASRRITASFSGSTISSTRRSRGRNVAAAALDVGRRQRAVAREILVELVGIAGLGVVARSADRPCRRSRRRAPSGCRTTLRSG